MVGTTIQRQVRDKELGMRSWELHV